MTKKQIISLFGYLSLVSAVLMLTFQSIFLLSMLDPKIFNIIIRIRSFKSFLEVKSFMQSAALSIINLFCGVGLLKRKEWGRKLSLYYGIGYAIYGLAYRFYYPFKYKKASMIINIFSILFLIFYVWFFTRKDVKEEFKR